MRYKERLMIPHFDSLGSVDVLDLNDGYSRILRPNSTAADNIINANRPSDPKIELSSPVWRHVNYFTFLRLFDLIDGHIKYPVILETGSSAHGTNSSMLFAALAAESGGTFHTVDLNESTVAKVHKVLQQTFPGCAKLHCHHGDSVNFIRSYTGECPNIVYLDSYDLAPDCYVDAAWHGYKEFISIVPKLCKDLSLILIDDTPASFDIFGKMATSAELTAVKAYHARHGALPGKGQLVIEAIRNDPRFEILAWEYQVLIAYREPRG